MKRIFAACALLYPLSAFALSPDSVLIAGLNSSDVQEFSESGATFISEVIATGVGGLNRASDVSVGPDGNIYVLDLNGDRVLRYSQAGTFIDVFVTGTLTNPLAMEWGPSGDLYISDASAGIRRFDGSTGADLGQFAAAPTALCSHFHTDGNVYVCSGNNVLRYNATTGVFVDNFYTDGTSQTLGQARRVVFGPDGSFFIAHSNSGAITRHDPTTGAYIEHFAQSAQSAYDLHFRPSGELWVVDPLAGQISVYDSATGSPLPSINIGAMSTTTAPAGLEFLTPDVGPGGSSNGGSGSGSAIARILQQGRLLQTNGSPIVGNHDLSVALFGEDTGGTSLWETTYTGTSFDDGYFAVSLTGDDDMGRSLDNVLDGSTLWMSIAVDGGDVGARQAVRNVPTSVRTHGAALIDSTESCAMVGGLGYDSGLYVCDGTSWQAVGAP